MLPLLLAGAATHSNSKTAEGKRVQHIVRGTRSKSGLTGLH